MDREELREVRQGICNSYKIDPYKLYTEPQLAAIIGKNESTPKRWREAGLIFPVIEPGGKGIRYMGWQIADIIMGRPQPWENTTSESSGLVNTGSPGEPEAKPGTVPGTTGKPNKRAALASALRTLNKQKKA